MANKIKVNLGIPIVIVVNKSDVVSQSLEKKKYEENSFFILKHIRKIALAYGASIVYTSGKSCTNLKVLYDYICNCLCGFELRHKPNISEKDAFFYPAGYDSLEILLNSDTEKDLEILYEERLPAEKSKDAIQEEEEICEETNAFLSKIKREKDESRLNKSKIANKEDIKRQLQNAYGTEMPGATRASKLDNIAKFERFLKVKEKSSVAAGVTSGKSLSPIEEAEKEKEKEEKHKRTKEEMLKKLGIHRHKKDGE